MQPLVMCRILNLAARAAGLAGRMAADRRETVVVPRVVFVLRRELRRR
jgi:hypothetical protein